MTPALADAERLCAAVVRGARRLIGVRMSATGLVVLCYLEAGVELADDLLALHLSGEKIVGSDLVPADLIFRTGRRDAFHPGDVRYGIGHVGICTERRTVVHASPAEGEVCEDTIDAFIDFENGHFRGVRRLIARA